MSIEPAIFLVDELVAQPGQGEALLRAYRERYVPGAQTRGLKLLHQLVSPPLWLSDQSNTLLFIWSSSGGARAWWTARIASGRDAQVDGWWQEVAPLIATRSRRFLAEADALERLADV